MTAPRPGPGRPTHVPDELAHAGPEHLDPLFVAAYDAKQRYDPAADVAALLDRGLSRSSVLLDVGCGTGTFTVAVAPHCARVIALDVSAQMLSVLATRAEQQGIGNIEIVRAGFLSYEHRGEPADVVFSRNALHHLPDAWKAVALARLADVMARGGLLWLRDLVYAFEPSEFEAETAGWFRAAVSDPAEGYTAEDLALHVRTEFSTFTWLLEPMLVHAGFDVLDIEVEARRTYARFACRRR